MNANTLPPKSRKRPILFPIKPVPGENCSEKSKGKKRKKFTSPSCVGTRTEDVFREEHDRNSELQPAEKKKDGTGYHLKRSVLCHPYAFESISSL